MRPHQRVATPDHAGNQLVDEGVLRTAQGREIEPRRQQELARIDASAVRRVEQERPAALRRLYGLERGIEFVLDFQHDVRRGFAELFPGNVP